MRRWYFVLRHGRVGHCQDFCLLQYLINFIINNETNKGQSYSIWNGIKKSNYNTIVTLDGDGQNNPKDIPRLLDLYFSKGTYSLIGGIRKNRKDNLFIQSCY